MHPKLIIEARIEELNSELSSLVKELEDKRRELGMPDSPHSVSDIVAFIQSKTLQAHGFRSAIAELKNVQEMLK